MAIKLEVDTRQITLSLICCRVFARTEHPATGSFLGTLSPFTPQFLSLPTYLRFQSTCNTPSTLFEICWEEAIVIVTKLVKALLIRLAALWHLSIMLTIMTIANGYTKHSRWPYKR